MKILNVDQIREADKFTIENEPVSSLLLMERAGGALVNRLVELIDHESTVYVLCGAGNNGGDGFVIARLLGEKGFEIVVLINSKENNRTNDNITNLTHVKQNKNIRVEEMFFFDFSMINSNKCPVIVDALFGSGLARPLSGEYATFINKVNQIDALKLSIDLPSGLFVDWLNDKDDIVFHSNHTFSIEFPKLSFFFLENYKYIGNWDIVPISLHPDFVQNVPVNHFYTTIEQIKRIIKPRSNISHKGDFGKALLVIGSYGMMGAAVLSAKSCMRSGVGLLKVHVPQCGYTSMQVSVPEAMVDLDDHPHYFTSLSPEIMDYADVIGVGCGIGKNEQTSIGLKNIIQSFRKPFVMDADAINILADNKTWLSFLPPYSILTPHLKEFERLTGYSSNSFERLQKLKDFSVKYQVVVVLKGPNSAIATPEGDLFFNSSGNSGLATAGSGDVLTGIIVGLVAQGYSSINAAILGVYLHGLSADIAITKIQSMESLIASDIIDNLGSAFQKIQLNTAISIQ